MALFTIKGLASYGQMVTLAKVGNRIIADYQRKIYDSLLVAGCFILRGAAFVGVHESVEDRDKWRPRRA